MSELASESVSWSLREALPDAALAKIARMRDVLEAMRRKGVRRIGFSSTGSIYGEPELIPTAELDFRGTYVKDNVEKEGIGAPLVAVRQRHSSSISAIRRSPSSNSTPSFPTINVCPQRARSC